MDDDRKRRHGEQLARAMSLAGVGNQTVADATGSSVRTVTNWKTGRTMPSERERDVLRRLLGPYDLPGDPVEIAVRGSELSEWRQDAVLSFYKRNLHEQRAEEAG